VWASLFTDTLPLSLLWTPSLVDTLLPSVRGPLTLRMLCRQGCADPLGRMLGRRCCWFTLRILCRRRCWSPSLADTLLPSVCGPLTLRMLCRQGCFDPLGRMLCRRCRWFFEFSRWMLCHRGLVRSVGSFCVDVSSRRFG